MERGAQGLPLMLVTMVVNLAGFAPRRHLWAVPENFNLREKLFEHHMNCGSRLKTEKEK